MSPRLINKGQRPQRERIHMQVITILGEYTVVEGPCAGIRGMAVSAEIHDDVDEVWIQVDPFTSVVTHSDNLVEV